MKIVRSYTIFVYMGIIFATLGGDEVTLPEKEVFTAGIFRKNASKKAKLVVDKYICDNLNQIYRFF